MILNYFFEINHLYYNSVNPSVCVSEVSLTPPKPLSRSTSFFAQMLSTYPGMYSFIWVTASQRSRSPEVIDFFSLLCSNVI